MPGGEGRGGEGRGEEGKRGRQAIKPGGRERRINEVNETLLTKMSLIENPRRGESEEFMYCRIHTHIALMTLSPS